MHKGVCAGSTEGALTTTQTKGGAQVIWAVIREAVS